MRRSGPAVVGGLLIALAVGRPLGAQGGASGEIGLSLLRFPDDSVTVLAPAARAWLTRETASWLATAAAGGFAATDGAGGSVDLTTEWRTLLTGSWRGDVGGELSGVAGTGSGSSGNALLTLRALRPVHSGGIWLRAMGSASRREAGGMWGRGVEAAGWWHAARAVVTASARREWSSAQLFLGPGRQHAIGTVPVRVTEGSVAIQADGATTAFSLAATLRNDPDAAQKLEPGFIASAVIRQSETRALVVSATKQLPDFARGADAVQSLSVSFRFNEAPSLALRGGRARPTIQIAGDSSSRLLRVRAPGARRVEVMGDFTEWEPIELAPTGDVFSRAVTMTPGTHRVVVRIDGGEWQPAANTPAVDDDLGGRVGLVVVP
ncbi:MAG: glycogen-binding domain-containing protein [Gemmatimonadota bacterium]|nr:glycogen-binding domain-containing protein [Gemmatimonadota bacterium]